MALRRPNRSLEIFSISALDLFASALGAFILVAVVLFPYYLKKQEFDAQARQLRQQVQSTQEKLEKAREAAERAAEKARQAGDAAGRTAALEAALRAAKAEAQKARERASAAEAQAAAADRRAAAAEARAKAAAQSARGTRVFALLGITTRAKTFVLLVDMSESMTAYTGLMVNTIQRLLAPMNEDDRITIIGFNAPGGATRLYPWTPNRELVAMTPAGKRQAIDFARQLAGGFAGKTPTNAALLEALKYPVESVILLSDGAPTDYPPGAIIQDVTSANAGRIEINCVAIGDYNKDPRLVPFLQELARRNRGDFTGVSG